MGDVLGSTRIGLATSVGSVTFGAQRFVATEEQAMTFAAAQLAGGPP